MIIPIIFRGDLEDLPEVIKAYRHYCDFTRFTTADPRISKNRKYVDEIGKIAKVIYENFTVFERAKKANMDLCGSCDSFSLPPIDKIPSWRPSSEGPWDDLPSRESQP